MTNRYLTKSRFKLACECPTKLFYTNKPKYRNVKDEDSFLQSLAEGGYQVGELAKLYYPGGHDITDSGYSAPLRETNELLQQENVIIYEAAVLYENLFIRIDVLVKKGNKVQLIEVKAKSFDGNGTQSMLNANGSIKPTWKPYLYDVAFQKYVLAHAFPDFQVESFLMLADKSKKATVDGLNQKFQLVKGEGDKTVVKTLGDVSPQWLGNPILTTVNVSEIVENINDPTRNLWDSDISFEKSIQLFTKAYEKDEKIKTNIGAQCNNCEFRVNPNDKISGFNECWRKQTLLSDDDLMESLVLDLWKFSGKQKCIENQKYLLSDLDRDDLGLFDEIGDEKLTQKQRQWLQIVKEKKNDHSVFINKKGLKNELKKHTYPLHFIDFETSMVAIPFYKNSSPYQQIAFQYSHHIMYKDGTVEHKGQFISFEKGKSPNIEFLRSLKNELEGDNGTIFRYADHENTVLNQIKEQLIGNAHLIIEDKIELIEFIDNITHKTKENRWGERDMVDMCKIVKDYVYDPETEGSISIKNVLPATLKRSKYIQNLYSNAIYGKNQEINSLNFEAPQIWIKKDESDNIISPYKLLPKLFDDLPEDITLDFLTSDNLSDGGEAMAAFAKMQFSEISELEREKVKEGLLRYCELDTLAMVMIYEYWLNEIENESS